MVLWLLGGCGDDPVRPAHPVPGIASISPASAEQGASQVALVVDGSDFVEGSVLRFGGVDRPTTVRSAARLEAILGPEDLAVARQVSIHVWTPAPGGGLSNAVSFTVAPRTFATPAITSLSPAHAARGAGDETVSVEGTGFAPESFVWLEGTRPTVSYVSSTRLTFVVPAAALAAAGILHVQVANPGPVSNVAQLEVRNPIPTISALSEEQGTAGLGGIPLRISGTGFYPETEVLVDGAPRSTTLVDAGTLEVLLEESDLRHEGTLALTVFNPGPGGGSSGPRSFVVVSGPPELLLLPATGASAGGPGFDLFVHGRGFVERSVVRWNGAERPTQYISGSRLSASISAADVASAGDAEITVHTPEPSGGTSEAIPVAIRVPGAAALTDVRKVPLSGGDLAYDPGTGRIYVSGRAGAPEHANTIVAVDPMSATITASAFVGSGPGRIARSDDGQYLYVGLDGASAVRRVAIASLAPSLQWTLAPGQIAGDLEVVPGRPETVVVARYDPQSSPSLVAVTAYDDGVALDVSGAGHTGASRIAFLDDPSRFYGYNNQHTGFEFFTLALEEDGAHHLGEDGGLISGFYTDIEGAAGRIYGTDGSIVDAERRVRMGSFPAGFGLASILPDPPSGRAFGITENGIAVYDMNTYQVLGTIPVSGYALDHPAALATRLVRWGEDGLAFLDVDELFLVRSPIVAR